jgi:hypothetical protein
MFADIEKTLELAKNNKGAPNFLLAELKTLSY